MQQPPHAIYLRVSTDAQSINMQRELIRQAFPYDGEQTVEYIDTGVSTLTNITDRPELGRLMADISDNSVVSVTVYSRDRISRHHSEWSRFEETCTDHGVTIYVASEQM